MKKNRTTIILVSVLGLLLLGYFIFFSSDEKRYQWFETYRSNSDQPYGTSFMKQMLESYRPGKNFSINERKPLRYVLDSVDFQQNVDYVFIGQRLHLSQQDADALLHFIESGNDAFVACRVLPESLIYPIYNNECAAVLEFEDHQAPTVTMNFYHDTLQTKVGYQYAYRFSTKDLPYHWNSINAEVFCDSTKILTPLGYHEGNQVNFFRLSYGKGNLYIHTVPLAFTNYFLLNPGKVEYAASVFSHLKGEDIIWDEYSKVYSPNDNHGYDSPLYYILQQPSLKYAWWMMLAAIVLYVFFAAKRTQRVIPVLEAKANTSLEFVNMISLLHYQNSNHTDIAKKKMKYFLYFIRAKYGIHAQTFGEEHIRRLAEKSKVNAPDIKIIFDQYDMIERHAVHNTAVDKLVSLYYAIENFYKHCK